MAQAHSHPDPHPWRVQSPSSRARYAAPILSVLLHGLLALVWLGFPLPELPGDEPQAMVVDLVPPPAPAPAPAPAPPASRVEPEKAKPQGETGKPIPQLQEGELAPKSTPVPERQDPKPAPPSPSTTMVTEKAKKPAPVSQNERDWVLSRVLRLWRAPPGLAAYEKADVSLKVRVMADGHFDDIYDSRRPWNPSQVFDGYGALPVESVQRRTIDSVYAAIRKAQPLALPQALRQKAPFDLRLDFRFKDVQR